MFETTHPEILFAERNGCGFWQLENPPVHFCDYCGCDIHEDDWHFDVGDIVCETCIDSVKKLAKAA